MKRTETPLEIIIERRTRAHLLSELAEVWRHRGLLWVLIRRDLAVRYKETFFGVAWAILQPLALMLVFWFALGRVLKPATGDVPYPLFAITGLLAWNFFSTTVSASAGSLVGAAHLIQKVYFPRLVIPLSTLGVALTDLVFGLVLMVAFVAWLGYLTLGAFLTLVPLTLIAVLASAVGMFCAALTAAYRDARYAIPLLLLVWMIATPVIYPSSILDPGLREMVALNPMAALVETFRNCLLGAPVDWSGCIRSGVVAFVLLWLSTLFFIRIERRITDTL